MNVYLSNDIESLLNLSDKTRQLICELYKCNYKGNITFKKLYPSGYQVYIPLSSNERPFSVSIGVEGEKFWKLLKQELREASLNIVENYIFGLHEGDPTTSNDSLITTFDDYINNNTLYLPGTAEINGDKVSLKLNNINYTTYEIS